MANKSGGAKVAAIILVLVGAANIGYGVYRMTSGGDFSPPLFIIGAITVILSAVVYRCPK